MTPVVTARALGEKAQRMIDALTAISASPDHLTRLYLTPEHKRAAELVGEWMREAGLSTRLDAAGTMRGSMPPGRAGRSGNKALLIGSHIDTVINAGRYDGNLGVVVGILAVETLKARGVTLPFGIDILAFGDEEGVRFPVTLTTSAVTAGVFDPKALDITDDADITLRDALIAFGGDPARLKEEAYQRPSVLGYLEVHIEQGPVLERAQEPLGVVTAIASQSRHRIRIKGEAGHAGTVPMTMRHDALAAAAEIILAIEAIAKKDKKNSLVATVGHVEVMPGASNVIPADVRFSLDVRAANDQARQEAVEAITLVARKVDKTRHVVVGVETMLEKPVATCGARLQKAIGKAVTTVQGEPARSLMSGAGHDGQSMAHLGEFGMIFVRCRAGISHNPAEFVTIDDMGLAVEALVETILELARQEEQP
ncbi:allantoate amidohydrolase [Kaistia defluvii]|uniref:allantoate amidohydrolase n=1 Tax=Kaistia defluvii TaxID=410841 RepID=UPI002250E09B|nr:allantoate amidohydrolase [Kaistia defluvii]MCX5520203.1 allantoate amidohydrolase [Kaistia defluvii]